MALITCPECKREVSDRAMSCPSCACPLERAMTTGAPGKKWKGIQLVSLGAIFLGILVAFGTAIPQGGGLCWIHDRWRADRPPGGHAGLHVSRGRVLGGTLGDNHFLDRLGTPPPQLRTDLVFTRTLVRVAEAGVLVLAYVWHTMRTRVKTKHPLAVLLTASIH